MTASCSSPRFSVVMPLYNKAAHVGAAVESALSQTFPAHEILVIDNGSTDGGRELVAALADERIKLLDLSTPGPGGYAGRNLGIGAASGSSIRSRPMANASTWHRSTMRGHDCAAATRWAGSRSIRCPR